jgi:hypothetical protein
MSADASKVSPGGCVRKYPTRRIFPFAVAPLCRRSTARTRFTAFPGVILQEAEQPSPLVRLPSSHSSPQAVCSVPSPQLTDVPPQAPLLHWSAVVHAIPSSQPVPSGW